MSDPFQLNRFLKAQAPDYAQALAELRQGRKRSHWMWYIFPQLAGLGRSATAQYYAIQNLDEARAYLDHPVLGPRLVECCATLFARVAPAGSVFERLLDHYFEGRPDELTRRLLGVAAEHP